ncbi:MAG: hypothetical protein ACJ790_10730 [Myxococcaceae bacterium]
MRAALLLILCVSSASFAEEEPTDQQVLFYNARIALREDRPTDALKLWLMRNSLVQHGERGFDDQDFRSVVWASLGKLGLCQDGFQVDEEEGAGLWPLALHNFLVQSLSKGPPSDQNPPWDAFEVGRQQRFVSLYDALSAEELRSVSFFRTKCVLPQTTMVKFKHLQWFEPDDRLSVGLLMRELLELSKTTLVKNKVESLAAVEARIFDLDLALSDLQTKRARRLARQLAAEARNAGVSKAAQAEMKQGLQEFPEGSRQAEFLKHSLTWKPNEWLTLSRQRRLSLFSLARQQSDNPEALKTLTLGVIDELIQRRAGDEVEAWIGFLDAEQSSPVKAELTTGDRGERLLELDPTTGFRERAVIALHRGIAFLQAGELQASLKSFAYALQHAQESRESESVRALSRRWLSFVLSRYQTTEEVISTLKALVPKQEYNSVIEDLVWRAALHADRVSFDRLANSAQRGGAFDARVTKLRPLAEGNPGAMATQLRDELSDETHAVLGFVKQLLENIEQEDADVRRAHVPTLKLVIDVLRPLAAGTEKKTAQMRNAEALISRAQAMLDGLDELDMSEWGKARAMSPHREAFAGSIRLAPSDALPWPFRMPEPEPPSAFTPLILTPVEWKDSNGALVFGWRISE